MSNNISKKIVFSFYVTEYFEQEGINNIHFKCLREYADIFDECTVGIIVDDTNDYETINRVRRVFCEIFSHVKKIEFITYENTPFRETLVFFEQVYKRLNEHELIFFGHNKGISNVQKCDNTEEIYKWVMGMYYYNLNFIGEVVDGLLNKKSFSYGAFLTDNSQAETNGLTKYGWYYIGTFFWVNGKKLHNYIISNNLFVPEMSDRFFDEEFLGNLYDYKLLASSHNNAYLCNATDFYNHTSDYVELIYPNDTDFYIFRNKIFFDV